MTAFRKLPMIRPRVVQKKSHQAVARKVKVGTYEVGGTGLTRVLCDPSHHGRLPLR